MFQAALRNSKRLGEISLRPWLPYPAHPHVVKPSANLAFHRLLRQAKSSIIGSGSTSLSASIKTMRTFRNRMFNRRHLFAHKGGTVDQEYLDKTNDATVR